MVPARRHGGGEPERADHVPEPQPLRIRHPAPVPMPTPSRTGTRWRRTIGGRGTTIGRTGCRTRGRSGRRPAIRFSRRSFRSSSNDADVAVTVASTWQPAPSPLPAWLGAIAGGLAAVGWWATRRRGLPAMPWLVPPAVLALVVGAWQYRVVAVGDRSPPRVVGPPGGGGGVCGRGDRARTSRRAGRRRVLGRRGDAARRRGTRDLGVDEARRVVGGADPDGRARLARPVRGGRRVHLGRRLRRPRTVGAVRSDVSGSRAGWGWPRPARR